MNLENLKELGLSEGQIAVYSAVLELGISTLNGIQEKTGIERRNIYDILNKLIEKGLVSYTLEKGKKTYQCTHPNKILEEIKQKQSSLKELENQKFPTDKIKVNYLGIDVGYFDSVSKTKRTFDAVFMGRLHKSKGIFDLVAIWKNILINLPNAKLAIIGTGEKKIVTELKDLIVKNGLKKNITMFGYLEDNHAYSLIKSSQVFVYPSYEEGFGMVIGEVMACKIPVIAYDLPAYTYTFKKAIQTVPLGNTHLFSRALLELLVSNEERERLTQKGYTLAKKYTWKSTVERERKYLW